MLNDHSQYLQSILPCDCCRLLTLPIFMLPNSLHTVLFDLMKTGILFIRLDNCVLITDIHRRLKVGYCLANRAPFEVYQIEMLTSGPAEGQAMMQQFVEFCSQPYPLRLLRCLCCPTQGLPPQPPHHCQGPHLEGKRLSNL